MNVDTSNLARHYDKLTPWERLPLIVAANQRDDGAEAERLARSAPRQTMSVSDYYGLGKGVEEAVIWYLTEQLAAAAELWRGLFLCDQEMAEWERKARRRRGEEPPDLFAPGVRLAGYAIQVFAEGWRLFCADMTLDPAALLKPFGCASIIDRAERTARVFAFDAGQALAYARTAGHGAGPAGAAPGERQEVRLVTPADVAAALRELVAKRHRQWAGG